MDRTKLLGDLYRIAEEYHFIATRVGEPGCLVRTAAADKEAVLREAIQLLTPLRNV